jgi:hypothetical protein
LQEEGERGEREGRAAKSSISTSLCALRVLRTHLIKCGYSFKGVAGEFPQQSVEIGRDCDTKGSREKLKKKRTEPFVEQSGKTSRSLSDFRADLY